MKVKKWHFVVGSTLPVIPLSVGLVAFAPLGSNKDKSNYSLFELATNKEQLNALLDGNYQNLSEELASNQIFLDWTSQVNEQDYLNQEIAIKEIEQLDLTFNEKIFLLKNYLEKVEIYQSKATWDEKVKAEEQEIQLLQNNQLKTRSNNVNFNYLYLKGEDEKGNTTYENLVDQYGNLIPHRGKNDSDADYGVITTDNTKFYWNNQTILNYGFPWFSQDIIDLYEDTFDKMEASMSKSEFENMIKAISDGLEKGDTIGKINSSLGVYSSFMEKYLKDVITISDKAGFIVEGSRKLAIKGASLSLLTMAIDIFKDGLPKDFWDLKNKISDFATDFGFAELVKWGSSALAKSLPKVALAGPIAAAVGAAVIAILSFIEFGNGHSIISNFNDHGLNDWDYQLSNNTENMLRNAVNWSYNYQYGIAWEIKDSWLYTPRLSIGTQGKSNWRNISGKNIFSNDFNWGHKIKVYEP